MGAWDTEPLRRVLGFECGAQALLLRNCVLGAACSPHFCLALSLSRASGTQAGVTDWAGIAVRYRVGRAR